mmetsp:Transcript_155301/g.498302  ORF Transcript_155301/g.498302 Transcript_155301/m.498302 type:complete len:265 (+) Transcript_155301:845-1639(+)
MQWRLSGAIDLIDVGTSVQQELSSLHAAGVSARQMENSLALRVFKVDVCLQLDQIPADRAVVLGIGDVACCDHDGRQRSSSHYLGDSGIGGHIHRSAPCGQGPRDADVALEGGQMHVHPTFGTCFVLESVEAETFQPCVRRLRLRLEKQHPTSVRLDVTPRGLDGVPADRLQEAEVEQHALLLQRAHAAHDGPGHDVGHHGAVLLANEIALLGQGEKPLQRDGLLDEAVVKNVKGTLLCHRFLSGHRVHALLEPAPTPVVPSAL